jgi:hypothetical protein
MMLHSVDAEYKEAAPLAVQQTPQYLGLFGTDDPDLIVEKMCSIAKILVKIVNAQGLVVDIKGKRFPKVEAWQTLAAMCLVNAVCEWTRPVEGGWEARVAVYNRNGQIIAAAEAQCTTKELGKNKWEDYAIRSMAATRAASKAYRSNLGHIMVLAGYQATPAEEITPEMLERNTLGEKHTETTKRVAPSSGSLYRRSVACGICTDKESFVTWVRDSITSCHGIKRGEQPSPEQCLDIDEEITGHEQHAARKAA